MRAPQTSFRGLHLANELLAFAIELAALGWLAWWGFTTGRGLLPHLLLGLGTPLAAAVLWGRYAAPKATVRLPLPGVLAVKALVFAAGSAALAVTAGPPWGLAFALLALVNTAAATLDRQGRTDRTRPEPASER